MSRQIPSVEICSNSSVNRATLKMKKLLIRFALGLVTTARSHLIRRFPVRIRNSPPVKLLHSRWGFSSCGLLTVKHIRDTLFTGR